jgi:hypothetical protein
MPDSSSLKVQFHYTFWDRIRSGLVMSFQTPSSIFWTSAFPVAGLGLLGLHLYYGTRVDIGDAVIIVLFFAFTPVFLAVHAVKTHFFSERKGKPYNYEFGDSGMRASSDTTQLTQSWQAISKIKRQGGFLLLFFSPRCAHCLPYRQLSELGTIEPILSLAREHDVRVYGI